MISSTLQSSKSSNTALKTSKHSGKNNGLQASLNNGNVQSMINKFKVRHPSNKFHLNKKSNLGIIKFTNEIDLRVKNPELIDQGEAYLCGPAAFLYCLIKASPAVYVKYMLDLWEFGEAKIGSINIKPSRACRSFNTSGYRIKTIDWMALASLRDATNFSTEFDHPKAGLAGITWPNDMVDWFKSANFSSITSDLNRTNTNDISSLIKVNKLNSSTNHAILLINSLDISHTSSKGKSFLALPNHWVVLDREIIVGGLPLSSLPQKNKSIEDYYSHKIEIYITHWGQSNYSWHTYNANSSLTLGQFLNSYYGYLVVS